MNKENEVVETNGCTSYKELMLNGFSAIQCCTDAGTQNIVFIEENMLLLVREGTLKFKYGNAYYSVDKNQMVFLKKNILIEFDYSTSGHGSTLKYIRTYLKSDLIKEFLKLAQINNTAPTKSSAVTVDHVDERLLKLIDSLETYFIEPEKVDGHLTKIKLLELLFNLALTNSEILVQLLDLREHFRTDITTTVEENIMNSISLPELAVLSGRSLSSFKRDFMAIYNMPPSQWVRQRRLEKAHELLINTTMTVTDVCYTLGFESLAHFSRLFKSYFGHSPSRSKISVLQPVL